MKADFAPVCTGRGRGDRLNALEGTRFIRNVGVESVTVFYHEDNENYSDKLSQLTASSRKPLTRNITEPHLVCSLLTLVL